MVFGAVECKTFWTVGATDIGAVEDKTFGTVAVTGNTPGIAGTGTIGGMAAAIGGIRGFEDMGAMTPTRGCIGWDIRGGIDGLIGAAGTGGTVGIGVATNGTWWTFVGICGGDCINVGPPRPENIY